MFERYTERARRALFFARYEASELGSVTIESEHLLLGLVREHGTLIDWFLHHAFSADIVRVLIGNRITIREKVPQSDFPHFSTEGKRILACAAEEAERLLDRHIGTEHLVLGILREPKSLAAEVLVQRGLELNAVREQLALAPMSQEHGWSDELRPGFFAVQNPALPQRGVVPDADTARHIAEAVWGGLYGAKSIASQTPLHAEEKNNVWIVSGSAVRESALFAFILREDGRILSVGRGSTNAAKP